MKWLYPHFHICLVSATMACFCPFITNNAIVVVFLFEFIKVNSIDAANAQR